MRPDHTDPIDPNCVKILSDAGYEVVARSKIPVPELLAIIPEYDGLIVRSDTKVTREVIEAGHKLKLIGRAGAGVDNIDVDAATSRGVLVMNTP